MHRCSPWCLLWWLLAAAWDTDAVLVDTTSEESRAIAFVGVSSAYLAYKSGTVVSHDKFVMGHNDFSIVLLEEDQHKMNIAPQRIAKFQLLDAWINYTVDLSKVGCGCNLAVYLISAPALDMEGNPSAGRGDYYCDANKVGGQWCPEVDLMEANTHAFQATLHKCDQPVGNGHYESCDPKGCGLNTRDFPNSYGPGDTSTIDTSKPFVVSTWFGLRDKDFAVFTQILTQGSRQVVIENSKCSKAYMAELTSSLSSGMSMVLSYWGDSAETISWLDGDVCSQEACLDSAGRAVISELSTSASYTAPAVPTSAPSVAPSSASTSESAPADRRSGSSSTKASEVPQHLHDRFSYDCEWGFEEWEVLWTDKQAVWCCKHVHRGCKKSASSDPAQQSPEANLAGAAQFDCMENYWNWEVTWSHDKLQWCCEQEVNWCPRTQKWGALPSKVEHLPAEMLQSFLASSRRSSSRGFCLVVVLGLVSACAAVGRRRAWHLPAVVLPVE